MGHGLSHTEIKAEPNLVPLLDLVFQLIMFFMICVNFVSEQVTTDIKLPVSQSARPMDKGEVDVLFLNMNAAGELLVSGQPKPLNTMGDKLYYLRQQYDDAKVAAQSRGDRSGKVQTAVIIRADEQVTYGQLFELMHLCKQVGYHRLQLRANTPIYKAAGG
jgi:biopolymer transport protein ExbD